MTRHSEPFSHERHQDVALLLARMIADLDRLGAELERSYGPAAADETQLATAALERVRERLDEQLARDYPPDPAQVSAVRLCSVYHQPRWADRGPD